MKEDLRAQLQGMLDGAYTIERELGGGGMSRVFTATDTRLNRRVVVKVLPPECAAGVSAERFKREIQFAAALQQANIVPLLAAGSTSELSYFTMPFVEGESLRGRLAKGALSISEVTSILRDVARALSYAHQHGVVHRDIKPDNVLLSQGAAVVTDFGIAKALSECCTDRDDATLTQLGVSIGTPAYMAPEQAAGGTDVDHRADLYAFGCLAYELLTGRPPFHGRSVTQTLAAQIGAQAEPVSHIRSEIPPALADLVMRCLAKDPRARPQSADDLMRVLDAVASGCAFQVTSPLILGRALAIHAGATVTVAVLARAAIAWVGLPEWVFLGAVIVMALSLPVVLWTGYVQYVIRRATLGPSAGTPVGTAVVTDGRIAAIALRATPHLSWRRTTRGTVVALGAFTAVVAGDMAMRVNGLGPFASLLDSGALNPDKSVLVAEFRSPATDSSLGLTVAEGVRLGLSASDAIHVMTQGEIAAALERMKRPASSRVDFATASEMAAREEVTAIVDGEVAALGAGYVVRIRLVTSDSGRVLFAEQKAAEGPRELIEGVDALTRALRGRIGESLKRVNAAPALARVTTTSLEALRWYTRGVIAGNREGDFVKSADFHRRAVAEDSTFAEAWRTLGTMYYNIGASRARRDSALERAYRFRDRLPRTAQNNIAASYFYAGPGRDRGKAVAIYQEMCDDGDTAVAANNLAVFLIQRREYATAESLAIWRLRSDPQMVQARIQLVFSQFQQGKLASAESTAVAGMSEAPVASTRWRGELALIRYAKGDLTGALNALDSLPRSFRSYRSFRNGPAGPSSGIAAVQGRLMAARQLYAQAGEVSARSRSPMLPLRDSIALGLLDLIVGRRGQAVDRLDAALSAGFLREGAPSDRLYLPVATLYAQAGRADRATEVLRERKQHVSDTSLIRAEESEEHRVLGEIALADQRGHDAVTEFWRSDSLPDGPSSSCLRCTYALVARAYDAAGESDSAIVYLERYLTTPDLDAAANVFAPDPLYLAPAHERLGQLYEAMGDIAKAVAHYRTFLDLWKHADPELQPRVAAARRRLATIAKVERMQ